jgi:3-oxoadipate enol-lactonase
VSEQRTAGPRRAQLSNGVTLSWREAGEGPDALVLIHGFPFNSASWRPQLEQPVPGWRIIAPDLRGFGESGPLPGNRLPMDVLAADVITLLQHLGLKNAVVGGLSMGGYVALALLRAAPQLVRALVLSDTRATPDSAEGKQGRLKNAKHVHAHGTAALIDAMLPRLLSIETRAERSPVEQELRAIMQAASAPAVVAALLGMAERSDSTPLLRNINVPTQVIVGQHDEITPPGDARLMARAIPGALIEIIAGAGHVPNLEKPAEFNRVLSTFLKGLQNQQPA